MSGARGGAHRTGDGASAGSGRVLERAPAKVNLLLQVGPSRPDGLHEICSLFASVDLADEVAVSESSGSTDSVVCPRVEGPNICEAALDAFRSAAPDGGGRGDPASSLPSLEVRIEKRIPVAAGLGGGSADAAAVLRAANELAGGPLDRQALRRVAAGVGADVPSQVEPGHALVQGAGEVVEPISLPSMWLVLVPRRPGLSTAAVYREADRIGATRARLEPGLARALPAKPLAALAASLENDLQAAALSLRSELGEDIAELKLDGALAALVTGSGPTVFGVFGDEGPARRAAARREDAVVAAIG